MSEIGTSSIVKRLFGVIGRFPLVSFIVLLGVLLGLIVVGNMLRAPEGVDGDGEVSARAVQVVTGDTPKYAEVSGVVESGRTVTVRASVAGIVERVTVAEGDRAGANQVLVVLADAYDGSSTAFVAEDIAERGVAYQNESYWKRDSLAEYQSDDVARTDTFEENVARKQFSIARDGYDYERDLADLELARARSAVALYLPKTPVSGTVERLFVSPGDRVNPGDALAVVSGQAEHTKIVVSVGEMVARAARVDVPTRFLMRDGSALEATPAYRSLVPTDGREYVLTYFIEHHEGVTEGEYLPAELPLTDGEMSGRLVPLSAVYIGGGGASVFVDSAGIAEHRSVSLGRVVGSYVTVIEGLSADDAVIADRSVSGGDPIVVSE
jgi:multidrug efflux pump subunit AcrA (membrane-fusion protein)